MERGWLRVHSGCDAGLTGAAGEVAAAGEVSAVRELCPAPAEQPVRPWSPAAAASGAPGQ
jgi:hypothetical protein